MYNHHHLLAILLISNLTFLLARSDHSPHIPNLQPRQATFLTCFQDNQLRALERFSAQATTFCPTYLTTTSDPAGALPSYISQYPSADITSACSCFQASATTADVVLTLPATPTRSSSSNTASVLAATAAAAAAASSSATSTPAASSAGLSTGAKAGIGVACGAGGLAAILGAAIVLRMRRRRRRGRGVPRHLGISQMEDDRGEGREAVGKGVGEGGVKEVAEVEAGGGRQEVESKERFELQEGGWGKVEMSAVNSLVGSPRSVDRVD